MNVVLLKQAKKEIQSAPKDVITDVFSLLDDLAAGKQLSMPISRPLPSIGKGLGIVESTNKEFRSMRTKTERFKTAKDFGAALGLSDIEMELVRQKKRIIEKLKIARAKKGYSQAKLANLIGSKQPAIARMESGLVSEVSMDFLVKAALALEVSLTIRSLAEAA